MRFLDLIRIGSSPRFNLRSAKHADQLEREIARFIPIGTPVAQAKQIMERNGFTCHSVEHETGGSGKGEIVLRDTDFLSCHKTSPGFFLIFQQDWKCTLEHKEGRVTRIIASTWVTGL